MDCTPVRRLGAVEGKNGNREMTSVEKSELFLPNAHATQDFLCDSMDLKAITD